jgi:hypothetical protein
MKKKHFTERQFKIIKMNYTNLAQKHFVHPSYVKLIATGQRPTNSPRSKAILKDLKALVDLLEAKN